MAASRREWLEWIHLGKWATNGCALLLPCGFARLRGHDAVPFVQGRDFRPDESFPGKAIVNEAFVQQCFGGRNPIGQWFEKETGDGVTRWQFEVIGVVGNAHYRNLREPMTPTAYVPFFGVNSAGQRDPKDSGSFIVRTKSGSPASLTGLLRSEVSRVRPELRVSNIRTQVELNESHTVRERLLAM